MLPAPQLFIGGEWQETSRTLENKNPSTGKVLSEIADASADDVDHAVAAAREAFGGWRRLAPAKRRDLLMELASLAYEARDEIARLESVDTGMPMVISKRLAAGALRRNLEYYAGWVERLYGDVIPVGDDAFDYTKREPYGVVAAIIPWNTPALFCGGKVGAALACGNTVVLKPSPWGSLTSLRFAEFVSRSGIPQGVVNVVTGGAETGQALVEHPKIDSISFTGSVATGGRVMEMAAARVKHIHLELGGKSPNIIFEDADLDRASFSAAVGCFGLTGQACAAGTRLLVARTIADEVVNRVVANSRVLKVGNPLDGSTLVGPLVSESQLEKVLAYIDKGRGEAILATGGGRLGAAHVGEELAGGYFVPPTIFTNCTNDMTICREEIFGPVLSVITFNDEDEAVAIANDTEYGLAAGVWTRDLKRAHRVADRLDAGTVWINSYGNLPNAAPFGGYKRSGFGRDGGREALDEYSQVKNVYVDLS